VGLLVGAGGSEPPTSSVSGKPVQRSDQHFSSSEYLQHVTGVPSSTVCFGRLFDLVLTILAARCRGLSPNQGDNGAPGAVPARTTITSAERE
jgi:hypothetical protein